ncbi:MAG: xanthine dehydrogenase family protein subunit M [Myxococcota bacterium]
MRQFEVLEPTTLDEALGLLAHHADRAAVLNGGTDLLVEIREELSRPSVVVNIKRVRELAVLGPLRVDPSQGLSIHALTTVREITRSPAIRRYYEGLAEAARVLGSVQVQARATVAGNLCRASPSADTLPPLMADDAVVDLVGPDGARSMPLVDFVTGPGQTRLRPAELLSQIRVPAPAARTGKIYLKQGRRQAMELATVGVAVALSLRDDDVCRQARVVLGAVAPTPIRVPEAEAALLGTPVSEVAIERAAEAAVAVARPITDVRGSAAIRRHLVGVLTPRAIRGALARALHAPASSALLPATSPNERNGS